MLENYEDYLRKLNSPIIRERDEYYRKNKDAIMRYESGLEEYRNKNLYRGRSYNDIVSEYDKIFNLQIQTEQPKMENNSYQNKDANRCEDAFYHLTELSHSKINESFLISYMNEYGDEYRQGDRIKSTIIDQQYLSMMVTKYKDVKIYIRTKVTDNAVYYDIKDADYLSVLHTIWKAIVKGVDVVKLSQTINSCQTTMNSNQYTDSYHDDSDVQSNEDNPTRLTINMDKSDSYKTKISSADRYMKRYTDRRNVNRQKDTIWKPVKQHGVVEFKSYHWRSEAYNKKHNWSKDIDMFKLPMYSDIKEHMFQDIKVRYRGVIVDKITSVTSDMKDTYDSIEEEHSSIWETMVTEYFEYNLKSSDRCYVYIEYYKSFINSKRLMTHREWDSMSRRIRVGDSAVHECYKIYLYGRDVINELFRIIRLMIVDHISDYHSILQNCYRLLIMKDISDTMCNHFIMLGNLCDSKDTEDFCDTERYKNCDYKTYLLSPMCEDKNKMIEEARDIIKTYKDRCSTRLLEVSSSSNGCNNTNICLNVNSFVTDMHQTSNITGHVSINETANECVTDTVSKVTDTHVTDNVTDPVNGNNETASECVTDTVEDVTVIHVTDYVTVTTVKCEQDPVIDQGVSVMTNVEMSVEGLIAQSSCTIENISPIKGVSDDSGGIVLEDICVVDNATDTIELDAITYVNDSNISKHNHSCLDETFVLDTSEKVHVDIESSRGKNCVSSLLNISMLPGQDINTYRRDIFAGIEMIIPDQDVCTNNEQCSGHVDVASKGRDVDDTDRICTMEKDFQSLCTDYTSMSDIKNTNQHVGYEVRYCMECDKIIDHMIDDVCIINVNEMDKDVHDEIHTFVDTNTIHDMYKGRLNVNKRLQIIIDDVSITETIKLVNNSPSYNDTEQFYDNINNSIDVIGEDNSSSSYIYLAKSLLDSSVITRYDSMYNGSNQFEYTSMDAAYHGVYIINDTSSSDREVDIHDSVHVINEITNDMLDEIIVNIEAKINVVIVDSISYRNDKYNIGVELIANNTTSIEDVLEDTKNNIDESKDTHHQTLEDITKNVVNIEDVTAYITPDKVYDNGDDKTIYYYNPNSNNDNIDKVNYENTFIGNNISNILNINDISMSLDNIYKNIHYVYIKKTDDRQDFDVRIMYNYGLSHSIIIDDISVDVACAHDDNILNIMRAHLIFAHGNKHNDKNNENGRLFIIESYLNYIKKVYIDVYNYHLYYGNINNAKLNRDNSIIIDSGAEIKTKIKDVIEACADNDYKLNSHESDIDNGIQIQGLRTYEEKAKTENNLTYSKLDTGTQELVDFMCDVNDIIIRN